MIQLKGKNMQKQDKQNINQKSFYAIRARENNPKALPYIDRHIYYPATGKPLVGAWYLLEYVLDTYPAICKQYAQIVESLSLPGCQLLIDDWLDCLAGEETAKNTTPEIIKQKHSDNIDFIRYTEQIGEFILHWFNREKDQMDGPRVTIGNSPALHGAIEFRTLANYYAFDPEKYVDPEVEDSIVSNSKDSKIKRRLTKYFGEQVGFKMTHKAKFITLAEWWYQSNVIYTGAEEYCRKLLDRGKGINLRPENVRRDIKPLNFALRIQLKSLL